MIGGGFSDMSVKFDFVPVSSLVAGNSPEDGFSELGHSEIFHGCGSRER